MRPQIKILIPLLLIATLAACSDLFNKNDHGVPKLTVQTSRAGNQTTTFNGDTLIFKALGYVKNPNIYPSFTSQINDQQIVINGYYYASSGFTPEATFSHKGNAITITIHAPESDGGGPSMPEAFFYNAYISNLSKSRYDVKIIHKNDFLRGKNDEKNTVFTKNFVIK